MCVLGDGGCACHDPRKPDGEQNYILPFDQCKNYIAIPPDDFENLTDFVVHQCEKK